VNNIYYGHVVGGDKCGLGLDVAEEVRENYSQVEWAVADNDSFVTTRMVWRRGSLRKTAFDTFQLTPRESKLD